MSLVTFTKEQHEWLREYIPGHHHREIMNAFNDHFHTDIMTIDRVRYYCRNHKIKTGFNGHFQKGQRTAACWKKGEHAGRKTEFSKGHRPHNAAPVGTIVKRTDGYMQEKIAEPNKWRLKHYLVWESVNGPVPKGMMLAFRDGDRTNCDINNLRLIHRGSIAQLSKFSDTTGEARDVAITIAELKYSINNRR